MKKKDVNFIWIMLVITWIIVLADAIVIHGLARERINQFVIETEKRTVNLKILENIFILQQKHNESIHYGR